jgi:hypothetical protein
MRSSLIVYALVASLALASCSSKVTTTGGKTTGTKTPAGKYAEDLSVLRPKVELDTAKNGKNTDSNINNRTTRYVEPKVAITTSLNSSLDSVNRMNIARGFVNGYTIQVYSGVKREEALNTKRQLSTSISGIDVEVQYVQPNFRVRAGKYYDRIQAQKDYIAIRKYFPNAIVLPERILINSVD